MSSETYAQIDPVQKDMWLAGFFESAGSVTFEILKSSQTSRPRLEYSDRNIDHLFMMQSVFGGSIAPNTANSYKWQLPSEGSIYIAQAIAPYVKQRRAAIEVMAQWHTLTSAEKLVCINTLRAATLHMPQSFEYQDIVQDPDYLAGIIDARARIVPATGRIRIGHKNPEFLHALEKEYGGRVLIDTANLGKRSVFGKSTQVKNPTFRWEVTGRNAHDVIDHSRSGILFKYDESRALVHRAQHERLLSPYDGRRLAYVFKKHEAKMIFSEHESNHEQPQPIIEISSSDGVFLQSLRKQYGGSVRSGDDTASQAYSWILRDRHAAMIAASVQKWSDELPEHLSIAIDAFSLWRDAKSDDDRHLVSQMYSHSYSFKEHA